jgi:hypothetical protein
MTERERWVVYPLLFLALGAALRDKMVDKTTSRVIVCQELQVVDEDVTGQRPTRTLARIGPHELTPGHPSVGFLGVSGIVQVEGDLQVDGTIQAKQFGLPGGAWESFLKGLQKSLGQAISQSSSERANERRPRE